MHERLRRCPLRADIFDGRVNIGTYILSGDCDFLIHRYGVMHPPIPETIEQIYDEEVSTAHTFPC